MKKNTWKTFRFFCFVVIGLTLSLVSGLSMIAQPSAPDDKAVAQEMSIQDYSPRSTLVVNEKAPDEYRTTLETTEKLAGIVGSLATLLLVINSTTAR